MLLRLVWRFRFTSLGFRISCPPHPPPRNSEQFLEQPESVERSGACPFAKKECSLENAAVSISRAQALCLTKALGWEGGPAGLPPSRLFIVHCACETHCLARDPGSPTAKSLASTLAPMHLRPPRAPPTSPGNAGAPPTPISRSAPSLNGSARP